MYYKYIGILYVPTRTAKGQSCAPISFLLSSSLAPIALSLKTHASRTGQNTTAIYFYMHKH